MGKWYVVNNFGTVVAGPFYDKIAAEQFANCNQYYSVVYMDK